MTEQIVMFCGHCGNETGFEIRGQYRLDQSVVDEEPIFGDITEWRLLQCITCSRATLEHTHKTADYTNAYLDGDDPDGDDWVTPTTFERKVLYPLQQSYLTNLPTEIEREYRNTLKVRNISPVACAALARRTLEAILTHEQAQGHTLMQKVDNLIKSDRIPPLLAEMAHLARKIGNLGAHFNTDDVTEEDVTTLLDFVETILEYLYTAPAKVEVIRRRLNKLS